MMLRALLSNHRLNSPSEETLIAGRARLHQRYEEVCSRHGNLVEPPRPNSVLRTRLTN